MERKLLVVGAQPHSLGQHIAFSATARDWIVTTAGQHEEDVELDVFKPSQVREVLSEEMPHSVVCTVGTEAPNTSVLSVSWDSTLTRQMESNFIGPMRILREWVRAWYRSDQDISEVGYMLPMHFVVISSNSAEIARSRSAGYCASKAALSMAIRCVARELAEWQIAVYAYEPGWIDGTPMSERVLEQLPEGVQPHRIPGNRVVNPFSFAQMIMGNIQVGNRYLNGCTLRVDGGEQ